METRTPAIHGFHGPTRFMSNFFPCEVEFEGIKFPSTEHAYVAAKTTDMAKRQEIALAPTPGQVKRIGRKLKLRDGWDDMRIEVMKTILVAKFWQPEFAAMLLATGDAYLEETNHWNDTFWGVCEGVGENHLGWLLMEIRDALYDMHQTS